MNIIPTAGSLLLAFVQGEWREKRGGSGHGHGMEFGQSHDLDGHTCSITSSTDLNYYSHHFELETGLVILLSNSNTSARWNKLVLSSINPYPWPVVFQ